MIHKYKEFISINEKNLNSSDEFLTRLSKIKDKNEIALILYGAFKNKLFLEKDLPQNWIDISSEDDVISFLSDRKVDMNDLDKVDAVSPIKYKGRNETKIGRFVRSFLSDRDILNKCYENELLKRSFTFNDKDIEDFVNMYKSSSTSDNVFKLVSGDDIAYWYNFNNYADKNKGTLGSSCMRKKDPTYFEIYSKNKNCQLLIYVDSNNKLLGRALVWKLSESPCNAEYFLDRIYTANDSDLNKFIEYGDSNNWMRKWKQTADMYEALLFLYKDMPVFGKVEILLNKGTFNYYPFFDTVAYMNNTKTSMSNIGYKDGYILASEQGEIERCTSCNGNSSSCRSCTNLLVKTIERIVGNDYYQEFQPIVDEFYYNR